MVYRNLSLNQFTGVFDGGVRTSGHMNVSMINNNISAVINLPSAFIDPSYVLHLSHMLFHIYGPLYYLRVLYCTVLYRLLRYTIVADEYI
jgi:hypothetical protein